MKNFFAILLTVIMIFTFSACIGGSAPVNDEQDTAKQEQSVSDNEVLSPWMQTKTGKFYSQFKDGKMYLEYETTMEGMNMTVRSATNGDKNYSESLLDGTSTGVFIINGNILYSIDHNSKIIIQMDLDKAPQQIEDTFIAEEDVDIASVETGTREINNKTYYTESWGMEGSMTTLCFDGDELAYMIGAFDGEEVIMKIIDFSTEVDDSLFELPEGYQTMYF